MPRIQYSAPPARHYALELFSWNMVPDDVVGTVSIALEQIAYVPVIVPFPLTVNVLGTVHRDNADGNIILSLYDADLTTTPYEPNNRLAFTAATANNGVNRRQNISITPVSLDSGIYFLAQEQDDAAATFNNVIRVEYANPLATVGSYMFTEDLGGFVTPPVVATPVQSSDWRISLFMIASSIP